MELNHDDPRYVTIYLNIDVGTPIKNDTEAVLISRGITGLVNVSLTGGTPEAGALLPSKADPIPTIKNGASLSRRLDEALNNVTHSLSELSKKMGLILTTENIDNLSNILSNTNTFTADLATVGDKINVLTEKATGTIDTIQPQIKDAAQAFSSFSDHLQGSTKQLENMFVKINSTLGSAESTLNTWGSLGQEANGSLQDVFPVLENALYNFSLFMQELEAKPNSIILGKPQQKPGPGE